MRRGGLFFLLLIELALATLAGVTATVLADIVSATGLQPDNPSPVLASPTPALQAVQRDVRAHVRGILRRIHPRSCPRLARAEAHTAPGERRRAAPIDSARAPHAAACRDVRHWLRQLGASARRCTRRAAPRRTDATRLAHDHPRFLGPVLRLERPGRMASARAYRVRPRRSDLRIADIRSSFLGSGSPHFTGRLPPPSVR
jgi:hypothetical protein